MKVSNIRKSQNLSLFNDRKSICLLPINLNLLFKKRYAKSWKVQYKSLQVVYNNYMATYDELLALYNKLKIHQRHLQFLTIEVYKSKNKFNPSFMWKTYKEKNIPYSLRRGISLFIPNANTQKYGINSLNFRGSVLWNNIPINKVKRM